MQNCDQGYYYHLVSLLALQTLFLSVDCAFNIVGTYESRSSAPSSLLISSLNQNLHRAERFHRVSYRNRLCCLLREGSVLGGSSTVSKDDQLKMMKNSNAVGLYVHIPFCRRRCRYCDFAIVPIGAGAAAAMTEKHDNDGKSSVRQNSVKSEPSTNFMESHNTDRQLDGFQKMESSYKESVVTEIKMIQQQINESSYGNNYKKGSKIPLRSIYFGGGTPSLASVETLKDILDTILVNPQSPFFVPKNNGTQNEIEISIEIDPGTFSLTKLQAFKDLGFNRLSLGVQSFDDTILEQIGRTHRRDDIERSIDMIRTVFGEDDANYSIDLISGLPGLSLAKWAETLEMATSLKPKPSHLSLYDLQIESGSVFGKWYKQDIHDNDEDDDVDERSYTNTNSDSQNDLSVVSMTSLDLDNLGNRINLPSSTDCAFMYKFASGYLKSKRYEHYEISSYALLSDRNKDFSDKRSLHNQIYWEIGSSWYAVGLGATSFVDGKRFARPRKMADYFKWLDKQKDILASKDRKSAPCWLPSPDDITTMDDQIDFLLDIIITRLRTKEGLDLKWVESNYGKNFVEAILKGSEIGLNLKIALHEKNRNGVETLRLTDPLGFLFSNTVLSSIFYEIDNTTIK